MSANTIKKFQYSVLFGALLSCLPTHAANYAFPGNLPAACSLTSAGNYLCSVALTLAAADVVTLNGPSTITIAGAFDTGAGVNINASGLASDLTLIASGIVTLGANNNFKGSITTSSAAINIGANNLVEGALTTKVAGAITVGADSTVLGNLTTASGAINVGERSHVVGAILTTVAGAITVGANAIVTGDVATTYQGSTVGAGAITLGANSTVTGAVSTNVGAITTGIRTNVTSNILAYDGAITVGANSTVGGSVCTDLTAAITVGADSIVKGNVETAQAGAITIGAGDKIEGAVTVRGAGARTIGAGATVGAMIGLACALSPDGDGDGIPDSVDEFPADKNKASSVWYPGSGTYGTVAYEDQWPLTGDYDLNDLVMRYRSRQILNAQKQVTQLEVDVRIDARGGLTRTGLALGLPGVTPDQVKKVALTQTKGGVTAPVARTVQLLNVTAEDGGVVFEIFPDSIALMPGDSSAGCQTTGFYNTAQGCPIQDPVIFKLTVELESGSNSFPSPPYDPFIFHTSNQGIEVHLPGKQPTSRANTALLGTGNDGSTLLASGKYSNSYTSKINGLPWALDVPIVWDYSYEKLDALKSYSGVAPWATSGGSANSNWYLTPAAKNLTFRNGR
jgi:LruC domain-containing protein